MPKAPGEIQALAAELPQLIADLSRGLSFIALSGAERELFFSELLAWHGATIEDAKRAGRTSALQGVVQAVPARAEPRALEASVQAASSPDDDIQASQEDDDVARLGLTNGTEVEVATVNGEVKRFKVGWMSPSRSVFIFSRYPRDHWTVRRPILNALLSEGRIRLVNRLSQTSIAIESLKSR